VAKTLSFIHRNSLQLELSCKDGEKLVHFKKWPEFGHFTLRITNILKTSLLVGLRY